MCVFYRIWWISDILKGKLKPKGDDPLDFRLSKGKRYKGSGNTFHQRFMGIDAISALCDPAHQQDTVLLDRH